MAQQKPQILYIHGGSTHKNRGDCLRYLKNKEPRIEKRNGWDGPYLDKKLRCKFQIIRPRIPLQDNARYEDWAIWFERYIPKLKNNAILIGQSLGGIFLAKYLSENKLPRKALSVYLVCPPFDHSLPGEDLVGGFKLGSDLSLLENNCKNLCLLFSKDDDVVPVAHAKKYAAKLEGATIKIYKSKNGYFNVTSFPEIVRMVREDIRKK